MPEQPYEKNIACIRSEIPKDKCGVLSCLDYSEVLPPAGADE